jgi:hypothetical protein
MGEAKRAHRIDGRSAARLSDRWAQPAAFAHPTTLDEAPRSFTLRGRAGRDEELLRSF